MTATEARAKLEGWRDLLKVKLEGVTHGPWHLDGDAIYAWNGKKNAYLTEGEFIEGKDATFCVFSRAAVPALLVGIEAVLKDVKKTGERVSEPVALVFSEEVMIAFAKSMEPYFKAD